MNGVQKRPFVIRGAMDGDERMYWNNTDGWVDRDSATIFDGSEWETITDPIGATGREECVTEQGTLYTWAQLETAAIMWEYVLRELRRHREARNPWEEYRQAYSTVALRCAVIAHAPALLAAYDEALTNKYEKAFDRDFVSQYMEDHVTRILT